MPGRFRKLFPVLLAVFLLVTAGIIIDSGSPGKYPAIRFCGGAREVGGSCYLVETGDTRFVVDCGELGKAGIDALPERPQDLKFMLLTHAHSDHCGMIPELYDSGFRGKVFCTEPTAALVPVMLDMSKGFKRRKPSSGTYKRALAGLEGVEFDRWTVIGDVSFRFRRAGHLLGASFIEILISHDSDTTRVVFSGDLGSGNSVLLRPREECRKSDYVVMESTYGGTIRDSAGLSPFERQRKFASMVGDALEDGGDVLIPAFTLGRTQEIIAVIDYYEARGVIPSGTLVYTDSPTAKKITDVYRRFSDELSPQARELYGDKILHRSTLREVKSSVSLKVHQRKHRPSIFISSSGDMDYTNSPRHFMKMFANKRNLLCLVGWMPPGSLGRRLADGEKAVQVRFREGRKIKREFVSPAIRVAEFHSFSGHADQASLLEWLGGIGDVKEVFLVHGEITQAEALQKEILGKFNLKVVIPKRGDRVILEPGTGRGRRAKVRERDKESA